MVGLLNNLPEKLTEIGEKTKSLKKARQLYEDFVHFVGNPNASCLPLLGYFIGNGYYIHRLFEKHLKEKFHSKLIFFFPWNPSMSWLHVLK